MDSADKLVEHISLYPRNDPSVNRWCKYIGF